MSGRLEVLTDCQDDERSRLLRHQRALSMSGGSDVVSSPDTLRVTSITCTRRGGPDCCGKVSEIIRKYWEHALRAVLIGSLVLLSQTLLQIWYSVAPAEFNSKLMLGLSNAFGDLFDLVTAMVLGKLPHKRCEVHLGLIVIGLVGVSSTLFCTEYALFPHDYVMFFGFCTVGISTCFQPMLMLCNVDDTFYTRTNAFMFALFKQASWASTWGISEWVYNKHGFYSIVLTSFILLILMALLAFLSSFVDPFSNSDKAEEFDTDSQSGIMQNNGDQCDGVSKVMSLHPVDSEHDLDSSPSSPLMADVNNMSNYSSTSPRQQQVLNGSPSLMNSPHEQSSPIMASDDVIVVTNEEQQQKDHPKQQTKRRSTGYYVIVMFLTGSFTFEAAVHSTALELLLQQQWNFSDSKAIDYFCMIPCVAALCFPLLPLLTSLSPYLQKRLKPQACASLCVLCILNALLPFLPSAAGATVCAVIIVMARTALLGLMSPFVEKLTKEKRLQARLIMVQNMTYNAVWSLASVSTGLLCDHSLTPLAFQLGAIVEGILFTLCLVLI